jgi:hypothetical protein
MAIFDVGQRAALDAIPTKVDDSGIDAEAFFYAEEANTLVQRLKDVDDQIDAKLAATLVGYATETYVDTAVADLVSNTALGATLADYLLISDLPAILDDYTLATDLATALGNYYTKTEADGEFLSQASFTTTIADYVTTTALGVALGDYVLTSALTTTLGNYVLTSALTTTLGNYVLTSALTSTLASYVLTSDLTTTLGNYVLTSALTSTLAGYVTTTALGVTLGSYSTTVQMNTAISTALGPYALTASLGTAAARNVGTANGNLVEVQSDGKILSYLLPSISITDTFVVASQAAMLALTAERGDIAIRTDTSETYILSTESPTTLADWKLMLSPVDGVFSFNTRTGAVTLSASDVNTALTYTAANAAALSATALTTGTVPLGRIQEVLAVTDLTTYSGVSGSGVTAIAATFTSLAGGDYIRWSGTNWVNTNSLDATVLTGALPAISGASLTSLTASALTGALPAISGALLTSLNPANLSSAVSVSKGGLALTTIAAGKMLYASALDTYAALTVGTTLLITTGTIDVVGANLTNIPATALTGTVVNARIAEVLAVTDLTTYASVSGTGTAAVAATFTSLATNDVLTWNGTNWINQVASGVSGLSTGAIQYASSATALAASPLIRESANAVAQRNSTTQQSFFVYNSYTDASNYSRIGIIGNQIKSASLGTGTLAVTTDIGVLDLFQEWNNGSVTFSPTYKFAVKNTASGGGIILQVFGGSAGTSSYLTVNQGGTVSIDANNFSMRGFLGYNNSGNCFGIGSGMAIMWATTNSYTGTYDVGIDRSTGMTIRVNNGTVGTGNIGCLNYARSSIAKTSNYTITAGDSGTVFHNIGAAGSVQFTLPTPTTSAAYIFTFVVAANQTLVVKLPTGVTMHKAGTATTSAGTYTSSTQWSVVKITSCGTVTDYVVEAETGTWAAA